MAVNGAHLLIGTWYDVYDIFFVCTGDGHKRWRGRGGRRRSAASGATVGAAHAQGDRGCGGRAAPLLTLHLAPRLTHAQSLVIPATAPAACVATRPYYVPISQSFKRFGRKDVFNISTVTYQSLERCDMMGLKN